jgi:pSer/pThr/pTyr-binding forkhead associated (FHA) protein
MIECPRCFERQLPNTLFCDQCGEELVSGLEMDTTSSMYTVRMELLDSRRTVTLPELPELIFGRSSGSNQLADVALDRYGGKEGGVSRRHARLSRRGMSLFLEDLGSMNGTFINDRRLPAGEPARVYPGDIIRLGLLRLTFSISSLRG